MMFPRAPKRKKVARGRARRDKQLQFKNPEILISWTNPRKGIVAIKSHMRRRGVAPVLHDILTLERTLRRLGYREVHGPRAKK